MKNSYFELIIIAATLLGVEEKSSLKISTYEYSTLLVWSNRFSIFYFLFIFDLIYNAIDTRQ